MNTSPRRRIAGLRHLLTDPPGPFRRAHFPSPLRDPWLTSVFSVVLLAGVTVEFVTGLLSYAAYNPDLGANDKTPGKAILGFYLFAWPTHPIWLYRLTQGAHVTLGLALIPVLLAKLWSVIPKLFSWPPVRSPAHLLERLSLLLLVGGAVFEFATGVANIQYWYVFPASFYRMHLYGAWIFIGAFVAHAVLKFPTMLRALRSPRSDTERRTGRRHPAPEETEQPEETGGLTGPDPATISRRGAVGLVGAGSLLLIGLTIGQSLGGPLRKTALLAPRPADPGHGPNGFQINKTAAFRGVGAAASDPGWRLTLHAPAAHVTLSRAELLAMPQHVARLPIACVEGWSTGDQIWSGVRLRDLARLIGMARPAAVQVQSLQRGGSFAATTLRRNQIRAGDSLLALRVNGAALSLDHGYPARVIVPDNPGVHNTKWVEQLTFTT